MGRCWSQGTKLQLCMVNKSIYLMSSMKTIVTNTVLYTGNLPREISGALTTKILWYLCEELDMLISLNHFTMCVRTCAYVYISKHHVVYLKQTHFFKKGRRAVSSVIILTEFLKRWLLHYCIMLKEKGRRTVSPVIILIYQDSNSIKIPIRPVCVPLIRSL